MGNPGTGGAETDLGHGILELGAIFGLVDGFWRSADQFAAVFFQHAVTM